MFVACSLGLNSLLRPSSWPFLVFVPRSAFQTSISFSVSGSFSRLTSPQQSFLLSSLARSPKCSERNHQSVSWSASGSWQPNWPLCLFSSSRVTSLQAFGLFPRPYATSSFRLTGKASLDHWNTLSISILNLEPCSFNFLAILRCRASVYPARTRRHFSCVFQRKIGQEARLALQVEFYLNFRPHRHLHKIFPRYLCHFLFSVRCLLISGRPQTCLFPQLSALRSTSRPFSTLAESFQALLCFLVIIFSRYFL